jgi:hypothetical protein
MKAIVRRACACLVGGISLTSLALSAEATQPGVAARAQRYRKVVTKERIEAGCARIAVDAPLETVRNVVSDFNRYSTFIQRTKDGKLQLQVTAKMLGRNGDKRDVYLEVSILKGTSKVWGVLRFDPVTTVDGEEVLQGRLLKGNVRRLDARWRLRKLAENKTELHLELLIVPNVPVPRGLVTSELEFVSDVAVTGARNESERRAAPK